MDGIPINKYKLNEAYQKNLIPIPNYRRIFSEFKRGKYISISNPRYSKAVLFKRN
jgi:hypothetical protein